MAERSKVRLVCGHCADTMPGVQPTTLAFLSIDPDGRVRLEPLVRTSGKPTRAMKEHEAKTGQWPTRGRRTFRSAPGPSAAPVRAVHCRSCGNERLVGLKRLAATVRRSLDEGCALLLMDKHGQIAPEAGWRRSHGG